MKKESLILCLVFVIGLIININQLEAQKIAFISSDMIHEYFPEAQNADQRINTFVEEWKRELSVLEKQIDDLEFEINKNRLIWSDAERQEKERQLDDKRRERRVFAKVKFETNGEFEDMVKSIKQPIEDKIYAAVQQVAAEEGYDLVFDKSLQPIPYTNYKYDITVKVLKKLGVDTEKLERELQEKIDRDPRNQTKDSKEAPKKRSRSRRIQDDVQDEDEKTKTTVTPSANKSSNPSPDFKDPRAREITPVDSVIKK